MSTRHVAEGSDTWQVSGTKKRKAEGESHGSPRFGKATLFTQASCS